MSEKFLNSRIINKHDSADNWSKATNFVPKQGELIVYDIDDNYNYERIKIGDGVQNVNVLPFVDDALRTELLAQISAVDDKVDAVSTLVGDTAVSDQISDAMDNLSTYVDEQVNAPKSYIILADQVNGYNYVIEMRNGNLISRLPVTNIEISTQPTKTAYIEGELFDPTGMVVIASYKDGNSAVIEDYVYPTGVITADMSSIEISYVDAGITCATTVPITVTAFDAATVLVDFEYTDNGDGTYTITGWKETYNGEPSTEMIIPNNGLIIV